MSKVLELMGVQEKINESVDKALSEKSISKEDIKKVILLHCESLTADVYSNMKEIEQFKYKLIELEMQLNNLTETVKNFGKKKWNLTD